MQKTPPKRLNYLDLCLIGHPVAQSRSPAIHNHWLSTHAIKGNYGLRDIEPGGFDTDINDIINRYDGFNLTAPHKQKIIPYIDHLSDAAHAIGAVNTVYKKACKTYGDNTDYKGFLEPIKHLNTLTSILVIGAGGAARAVLYGLKMMGINQITVTNRSFDKIDSLATITDIQPLPYNTVNHFIKDQKIDLIINTTSCGMAKNSYETYDALPFDFSGIDRKTIFYDLVYNPLETDFLKQARHNGHQTINGLDMLLHQAAYAFKHWTDVYPTIDDALKTSIIKTF